MTMPAPFTRKRLACCTAILLSTAVLPLQVNAQTRLLWGDTHLHTNFSQDAYATGTLTVTPDMAYRFARGIPIVHPRLDTKIQIDRPLDFLAVTDHAIGLGLDVMIGQNHELLQATENGRALLEAANQPGEWPGVMRYRPEDRAAYLEETFSPAIRTTAWQMEIDAAEKNYIPGTFTTLFGWEWTSAPGGKNLHRCVITDGTADLVSQFMPFSNADSLRPEDFWNFLQSTSDSLGIDFVAIPHNSNISGGLMFDEVDSDGRPMDVNYALTRMRWEPLVEVTQTKGTSEVHPALAPNDEFAEYEIRRKLLAGEDAPPDPADYVRSALLRGMEIENRIGENPYKFGMLGATDNHVGMTQVEEDNFQGKLANAAHQSERLPDAPPIVFPAWEMSASGLTAVWAEENTRESIFAAFKRKEVYGTTGPRISLRVFGGFSFNDEDAAANDIAEVGYRKGFPMGSDLASDRRRRPVSLLIHAAKDPVGANLDRVQVIKGWIDENGEAQQKIYDVAWSGDREQDANGSLPAVGNTVDLDTAQYSNSIGATQLAVSWVDPDFEPNQMALYYVRVLEIPTPRHSLYDAVAMGIDAALTGQAATIQERAYSSPIWYSP